MHVASLSVPPMSHFLHWRPSENQWRPQYYDANREIPRNMTNKWLMNKFLFNASGGTISRFQLVAPPGQRMGPLCLWQCFYWYTSEEWWWYSALMQCHTHHCYDNSFSSGGWMYRVIRSWIDIETILLRTRLKKDSTTGKTKLSLFFRKWLKWYEEVWVKLPLV